MHRMKVKNKKRNKNVGKTCDGSDDKVKDSGLKDPGFNPWHSKKNIGCFGTYEI